MNQVACSAPRPKLSIVIPVFNGAASIGHVVERSLRVLGDQEIVEVVLVNDGSEDNSEAECKELVERYSGRVVLLQLSRNFGEHNAVLAGMALTQGKYVAVLDDDAQNPPEEVPRMLAELESKQLDVVYGRYIERKHSLFQQLGSWFNDRMANVMLRKPKGLYLSSFKVANRFLIDQIVKYQGPYPYIDGLICRTTNRMGQIDVRHDHRCAGKSNYTLRRLLRLWLNMFLGFSILPLRLSVVLGFVTSASSVVWLLMILIDKLWITPSVTIGIPTVLACIVLFSGVQLIVLGTIGEYVGRVFLAGNGMPQYIVRYCTSKDRTDE